MPAATLLLPERSRLPGRLPQRAARALGRAERGQGQPGVCAQLRRHFRLRPDRWPVAALTRQLDAGDAAGSAWLRADPAHVAPDLNGARLLAHGEALALDEQDLEALLPALRPLFGDAGFLLDAPHPARWYLRAPVGAPLPEFAEPDEALGDDLFEHLPGGSDAAARRWRALLTEVQVTLHQHPWNQARAAQGRPAVNSLWFWGAGTLPDAVETPYRQLRSRDPLLCALALAAGVAVGTGDAATAEDALVDLRHLRSFELLVQEALLPLLGAVQRGELDALALDFEDGARFALRRADRWRLWRRPLPGLGA